jgi:pyruvate/2-oxoglutarate dehydrogenase complex dihydrolipoamide acyltransferase (E2) component
VADEIRIPQLGITMTAGTLSEWLVSDGEDVVAGQPLYILGTDKIETEIESPVAGIIRIRAESGSDYPVGTIVAEIG